jgi:hypothetical protein
LAGAPRFRRRRESGSTQSTRLVEAAERFSSSGAWIAKPGMNGRVSMLLQIIVVLIVVGVLLWLVNNYIPMDGKIKSILNVVVVILVILWLLQTFGLLGSLGGVGVH